MRNLILAAVFVVLCTVFVIGQQRFTPIQPTGSLNHTVIDGLPTDANKGAARTTSPIPSGCEATTTFIANNQMGVLRCDPATLGLYIVGLGTAGTASGGVLTVQGQAGMTPLTTTAGYPGVLKGGNSGAMTATTSTQVIAATAGSYTYVTHCSLTNDHGTVDTDINFQDGSAGTVIPGADHMMTPHGGGRELSFPTPLKVPTLGNGLYAVNVTTGSSTYVSCSGFTSATSY